MIGERSCPGWLLPALAIALAGLWLRLVAASGGLWLDEAWSAVFAREAGDPAGVFLRINHDNNHHLNTLWLQHVGMGAPAPVQRALAVTAGAVSILVAAAIASRGGFYAALATAALFAASPFMLLYGSEARGYAPAIAAILGLILIARRWLDGVAGGRGLMAVLAGLGMISHFVTLPSLVLVMLWTWLERDGFAQPQQATRVVLAQFDLALVTAGTIAVALLGGAAMLGGMVVGGHTPFSLAGVRDGMLEMVSLATGFGRYGLRDGGAVLLALALLAALALVPPRVERRWLTMAVLFLAAMPCAAILFHVANTQFGRYYLIGAIGLLLFAGARTGALLAAGGWRRAAGIGALALLLGAMLLQDRGLLANARGAPDRPVALMKAIRPGATVLIAHERSSAPLRVASAQLDARLTIKGPDCAPADFYLLTHYALKSMQQSVRKCGKFWRLVAGRDSVGPSGEPWALYAREGLQSTEPVVNGPLPAR
jgi:hypothetical protein